MRRCVGGVASNLKTVPRFPVLTVETIIRKRLSVPLPVVAPSR